MKKTVIEKVFGILILINLFFEGSRKLSGDDDQNRIDNAVRNAVTLVEKSAEEYLKHRECFSCHHQSLPILALAIADDSGYQIDRDRLRAQVRHTLRHFKKNEGKYRDGKGTGGQVDTAGYGLWALNRGKVGKDAWSDAVVDYLLERDKKRVFWRRSSERPPSEASNFATTFLAVLALNNYGQKRHQQLIRERKEQVKKWVIKEEANDTEDLVFKINLLMELGIDRSAVKKFAGELAGQQKSDGGWSQLPGMKSDPYATSTAMYALMQAGNLKRKDSEFKKGIEFLLNAQKPDGSWHVVSRSSPFQEYFESGFPHGKDQFISITATCWAMMVLSLNPAE